MRGKQKNLRKNKFNKISKLKSFFGLVREKLLKLTFWFAVRIFLTLSAILLTAIIYFFFKIPPFESILDGRSKGSVTFLDKNGETFAWRGQQFDESLRAKTASPFLINAIISSEDQNFNNHFGISIRGILGAIIINLREGRRPFQGHGGSTITQQVAKLLCLMKDKRSERDCRRQSLARKILEVPFSIALEIKFSKEEILSIYMNRVYLGANAIGFEAASRRYFNKSATVLSLAESAMLAALLSAPSRYAPTHNLELAQTRSKLVIQSMLELNYISALEAEEVLNKPATLSKNAKMVFGSHFADWVMYDAPAALTIDTTEDIIIRTPFDPIVQRHVEDTVAKVFALNVVPDSRAEAAVVVISAAGDVVAMLGSRKKTRLSGQYNRAFQAYRQPGSAFKPFVYAAALQKGYNPSSLLFDTKKPPSTMLGLKYWPKNHDDKYHGKVTLNDGLARSVNTATVHLAHLVGIQNVINVATGLGIKSKLSPNLSLALGSSEVSLLNLTSAYASILNLGRQIYPRGWYDLRLKSTDEIIIRSSQNNNNLVIDSTVSKALINMLVSVVKDGTGQEAYIDGWDLAGKTGTSQNSRDAWFIGFTSEYVVGVWMGSDDNKPLKGVVGGNLPSQIWSQIIKKIHIVAPENLPTLSAQELKKAFDGQNFVEKPSPETTKPKHEKNNFFMRIFNSLSGTN